VDPLVSSSNLSVCQNIKHFIKEADRFIPHFDLCNPSKHEAHMLQTNLVHE
jgi:hypothetical protein